MNSEDYNSFVYEFCNNETAELFKNVIAKNYKPQHLVIQDEKYPYHHFVFHNEYKKLLDFYLLNKDKYDIDTQDELGNTPLILAAMKGFEDSMKVLIFLNAKVSLKNFEGWSAIEESVSYGNVQQVKMLLILARMQSSLLKLDKLNETKDFILDFKWVIESWMPLVSRFLPSDKCTLIKCGNKLRLNSTLMDFSNHKWIRGNLTCLINPDISLKNNNQKINKSVFILDHDLKIYESWSKGASNVTKSETAALLKSEIVDPCIDVSNASYEIKKRMWPFNDENQIIEVGNHKAVLYDLVDIKMIMRKRREHLSKEDLSQTKKLFNYMKQGKFEELNKSLELNLENKPAPEFDNELVSWKQYRQVAMETDEEMKLKKTNNCKMKMDHRIDLGRKQDIKVTEKEFKLSLGMNENFPFEIQDLINVLEVILDFNRFNRLREILNSKLPPGFPVYIEVPIFPTVSAKVYFENIKVGSPNLTIDSRIFELPNDYKQVNNIWAKRNSKMKQNQFDNTKKTEIL